MSKGQGKNQAGGSFRSGCGECTGVTAKWERYYLGDASCDGQLGTEVSGNVAGGAQDQGTLRFATTGRLQLEGGVSCSQRCPEEGLSGGQEVAQLQEFKGQLLVQVQHTVALWWWPWFIFVA
jgi:hypothetical protein